MSRMKRLNSTSSDGGTSKRAKIDIPPSRRPPRIDLDLYGPFSHWTPDHVILESSEERQYSFLKATLSRASGVFKDMFSISELHNDSPIFTSISSNDLYNLLVHIDHFHRIPRPNHQVRLLSLNEKIALVQSAERFDCNQVQSYAQGVLDDYYKQSTALDLLEAASNAKSIATGKIAILKMQTDKQVEEGGIYNIWFAVMKRLRATWQVEFHRLFWEPSAQLVNRPENEPERTSTWRRRPRTREAVFITTNRSFKEIAERFNPKSEG